MNETNAESVREMNTDVATPPPAASPSLGALPDEARVWVYPVARDLESAEQTAIVEGMLPFFEDWKSHGRVVHGAVAVLAGRFVVLAAQMDGGDISGCGIDASVHALEPLLARLGLELSPPLDVHYRSAAGSIVSVDRLQFKHAVDRGLVTGSAVVYDTNVDNLGILRRLGLERVARESWHSRAFGIH